VTHLKKEEQNARAQRTAALSRVVAIDQNKLNVAQNTLIDK
jgi:hypothetical protein